MNSNSERASEKTVSTAAEKAKSKKPKVLPCGSKVCVRCHRGCGVVMAAYLAGLDEPEQAREEGNR